MSIQSVEVPIVGYADAQLQGIGRALKSAASQSHWSLSDDQVVARVDAAMRLRAQAVSITLV